MAEPELRADAPAVLAIVAEGGARIALRQVSTDQDPVRALAHGIHLDCGQRRVDRVGVPTKPDRARREALERVDPQLAATAEGEHHAVACLLPHETRKGLWQQLQEGATPEAAKQVVVIPEDVVDQEVARS